MMGENVGVMTCDKDAALTLTGLNFMTGTLNLQNPRGITSMTIKSLVQEQSLTESL